MSLENQGHDLDGLYENISYNNWELYRLAGEEQAEKAFRNGYGDACNQRPVMDSYKYWVPEPGPPLFVVAFYDLGYLLALHDLMQLEVKRSLRYSSDDAG